MLGEKRAKSMQNALLGDGVPASRIRIVSYGKEKPFCTDSNQQCWQQNQHRDQSRNPIARILIRAVIKVQAGIGWHLFVSAQAKC